MQMTKGRKNQEVITFKAKASFVAAVNAGLQKLEITNRSDFFREAIKEKLAGHGIQVDAAPNSRIGVGGRPRNPDASCAADRASLADDLADASGFAAERPGAAEAPPGGPPGPGSGAGSVSYLPGSKRKPRSPHNRDV